MADRDRSKAEALRIAHERLEKLGYRYSHEEIGTIAGKILKALGKEVAAP